MKNKKLGVFAILGVLSITGIGFGIATGEGSFLTNVEANEVGSCVNTWNKQTAPTLTQDGSGTAVAGHVETKYSKAAPLATGHVTLYDGGSMATANYVYDEATQLGGYCNGITSITINYKDNAGAGIGLSSDLSLTLSFGSQSKTYSTGNENLTSGEPIVVTNAPRSFSLKYSVTDEFAEPGAEIDKKYNCAIESVSVTSTMFEQHTVSLRVNSSQISTTNYSLYEADETMEARGALIEKPSETRLAKGQIVAFAPNENHTKTIAAEDLTIEGGTLRKTAKLGSDVQPTFFIEVTNDLTITINAERTAGLYAGRSFVGDYSLFALKSDLAKSTLKLTAEGKLLADGQTFTYTANDKDVISVKDNKYRISFYGDVVSVYKNFAPTARYIGIKGADATITPLHGSNEKRVVELDVAGTKTKVYVQSNYTAVEGYLGTTFETSTTLIDALPMPEGNYVRISAPLTNGKSALDSFAPIDGKLKTSTHEILQLKIDASNAISGVYRESYAGTYVSVDQTLTVIVDGYGNAKVNDGEVTTVTKWNNGKKEITIGDQRYVLDTSNMTVEKAFVDPLNDGATRTYQGTVKGNAKTITIANGKFSTNCESSRNNGKYEITKDYVLTVSFSEETYYEYITIKYQFKVSEDLTTLTALIDAQGLCYGEPAMGYGVECPKGTVFTLVA